MRQMTKEEVDSGIVGKKEDGGIEQKPRRKEQVKLRASCVGFQMGDKVMVLFLLLPSVTRSRSRSGRGCNNIRLALPPLSRFPLPLRHFPLPPKFPLRSDF